MIGLTISNQSSRWVRVEEEAQIQVPDRLQGLLAGEEIMIGVGLLLALLMLFMVIFLKRKWRTSRQDRALRRAESPGSNECNWQRLPSTAVIETGSRWYCTTCHSEGVSYNNRPPKTCKRAAANLPD